MTSSLNVESFKHKGLSIDIDYDQDLENPCDMDSQWKVYSFSTSHASFKEPSELGLQGRDASGKHHISNPGLRQKLKVGLAFFLSYYEHGLCSWSVQGTRSYPDMQWDGVSTAGIMIWEHPPSHIGGKTYEERQKDAEGFMEMYTAWCNGHGYCYVVKRPCGACGQDDEILGSCGGYYGIEEAKESAIEEADHYAKKPKKKVGK
jgi:hypothetical protein